MSPKIPSLYYIHEHAQLQGRASLMLYSDTYPHIHSPVRTLPRVNPYNGGNMWACEKFLNMHTSF